MRLVGLLASILLLTASPSWAATLITELTRDNLASQSFDFTFERSDRWFYVTVKITVRPRNEELSKVRDRVGGRLYRCQEGPKHFELQATPVSATEKDGSLVYTFRVRKGTHKCFYFWRDDDRFPSADIWWVSLDSPLLRGDETPK